MKKDPGGLSHPNVLVKIIRALVRSRLAYGQEVFYSAAPTLLRRLESRETHFLKIALGMAKHADPMLVYRETGLLPLQAERELRTAQYVVRAGVVENSTTAELNQEFNDSSSAQFRSRLAKTPNVARRGLPIHSYTQELLTSAKIDPKEIEKQPAPDSPPWMLDTAAITVSLSSFTKAEQPLYLATIAKEKISSDFANHLAVFTDGSKLDNGQTGCAFVIPELSTTKMFRLNNDVSIFSAEMYAIFQALRYLETNLVAADKNIVILSDSRSALQALERPGRNRAGIITNCLQSIHNLSAVGHKVSLCWIPSHVGIHGNELADCAAKHAAVLLDVTDNIGFSVSEAYSKLKAMSVSKWKQQFSTVARQKGWVDPVLDNKGVFPNLPHQLFPLFYRLRTKALRIDFVPQKCVCGQDLKYAHLFQCVQIRDCLGHTVALLGQTNGALEPASVLSYHVEYGWGLAQTFVREVSRCPVGHLV